MLPLSSIAYASEAALVAQETEDPQLLSMESDNSIYSTTEELSQDDRRKLRSLIPPFTQRASIESMAERFEAMHPNLSPEELRFKFDETVEDLKMKNVINVKVGSGSGPVSV